VLVIEIDNRVKHVVMRARRSISSRRRHAIAYRSGDLIEHQSDEGARQQKPGAGETSDDRPTSRTLHSVPQVAVGDELGDRHMRAADILQQGDRREVIGAIRPIGIDLQIGIAV